MQCQGDIFYSSTAIVFFSDAEEYRPHLATSSSQRVGVLGTGEVTEVTSLPYCASIAACFIVLSGSIPRQTGKSLCPHYYF